MSKNILSMLDMREDLGKIIDNALSMKSGDSKKGTKKPLSKKNIAMLFEKPSLRTKGSFAVAIQDLGGNAVYMAPEEIQIGKRESASDIGKVLSRYFDMIVYRAFSHDTMIELAESASIPVINALDNHEHPCQVVADLMTLKEKKDALKGIKLAYIGDANNVCNSLILGSALSGVNMAVATPSSYSPKQDIVSEGKSIAVENGCTLEILTNPFKAAENADAVYTDVWISMGEESYREEKEKAFLPYKVTQKLMEKAKKDAIFLHCLPAHRSQEVDAQVIDGEQSVVFDQAENRLHAHKAMLIAAR